MWIKECILLGIGMIVCNYYIRDRSTSNFFAKNIFCFEEPKCVRPLFNYFENFGYSKKYGLIGCAIQKSMSTFLASMLCYLNDEEAFIKANRTLNTELWENT